METDDIKMHCAFFFFFSPVRIQSFYDMQGFCFLGLSDCLYKRGYRGKKKKSTLPSRLAPAIKSEEQSTKIFALISC